MSKTLIIAEKPSVANDIARALGGFSKQGDYLESDRYVLSSAVGHLVEIKAPEAFEVKRGKWSFNHLPVLPPHFELNPISKTEDRLKLLTRLLKRKDITEIINACDAGREGELIFRLIVQYANAKQPIKRLWLQSMTQPAIRDGFSHLREDRQMLPLADAARCRSEADWMVGINGTRAMTAFNSRDGGFYLTTVGRVQTPTLTIVVEREERIKKFVSRDYFEVRARFGAAAGSYDGRWYDPNFKKGDDQEARAERLWDKARAEAIVAACTGQPGEASDEAKPTTQLSPLLFDLTSLQREANGRFGFSARNTLAIAQALYERHKVLTYPRTDSRALPEDYLATVKSTMEMFNGGASADESSVFNANIYQPFAQKILRNEWVRPNKRVFDNTKVSDHFAIVPTLQLPKSLSEPEQRIYDMVVKRFLAVFYPAAEYLVTTRTTKVAGELFKSEGKVLVKPGWLEVYGRAQQDDDHSLVPLTPGAAGKPTERVKTESVEAMALQTKPPPRYTEATLLSAMEGAGKAIEDDELREAMAEKGLGTPATRASIIEGLIAENYMVREGRELIPTTKAFQLMTLLRGLGVTELTMPEMTGGWEYKLALMERGQLARSAFMTEIAQMARQIVERAKNYQADTIPGDYATLHSPCPKCGAVVKENYKRFACTKCDFSITKIPGGRQLEVAEADQLLRERSIGPLQGFRSRLGRPFAAIIKLTDEHKLEFDFGNPTDDGEGGGEPIDFSDRQALGQCPKCGGRVFEHGMNYLCEHSVGPNKSCDFRTGKVILQQAIEPVQLGKLLAEHRTDLLTGFVSSRTRRKFKAYLVIQPGGKVGFEFEARKNAAPAQPSGQDRPGGTAGKVTKLPTSPRFAGSKAGAGRAAKSSGSKTLDAQITDAATTGTQTTGVKASRAKVAGSKATAAKATGAKAAEANAKAKPAKAPRKKPAASVRSSAGAKSTGRKRSS